MKHYQKYLVIFLLLAPVIVTASEWYEGGTLHQATAKEWHAVSSENQLATAADFVAKVHYYCDRRFAPRRSKCCRSGCSLLHSVGLQLD